MKYPRIAALVVAVPLVLGMAACGSNPSGTASSDAAKATGPVTIEYMHRLPDGDGMTKVADIAAKWNKEHPDIQVKTTKFDGNAQEMITRLQLDINNGTGPCLAQLGYNEVPEMYAKGMTLDVTKEADQYKSNYAGGFGQMTVGGTTVGLPQDTGPLIYMYNATEFENLGIKVPTTLGEFETAAATAAAAGKYIGDFMPDEAAFWLSAQTAAAGGVWYKADGDKWKVSVDGDASQKVAEFWQKMIDSKTVMTENRWGDTYDKAISSGTLIGNIVPAWETGFALDSVDGTAAEGQWRIAQVPDFGTGVKTGPDGGSGVAVMKGCQYPEQAMEFNNWFNTQVDDLWTQGLVTAAAQAPSKQPAKMQTQFGGQDVVSELLKANKAMSQDFIYIPGFSSVQTAISKDAAGIVTGEKTVADVFKTGQEVSLTTLKNLNLPVEN